MTDSPEKKSFAVFDHTAGREAAKAIESAGAKCLLIPAIRIECRTEAILGVLPSLSAFHWIGFADVFAVDQFIWAMQNADADLYELELLRVAACGETVSDALRYHGVHSDVVPLTNDQKSMFATLDNYVGGDWDGLRFLAVGGAVDEHAIRFSSISRLSDIFRFVAAYDASFPAGFNLTVATTMLTSGGVDIFVLADAGDAEAYRQLTGGYRELAFASSNDAGRRSANDAGIVVKPLRSLL
jgi:uroporphyrinogen-III synthase